MANRFHGVTQIVSGGQTGVDRAALDAAMTLGIEHGGWCPRGRLAEDGTIASKYQLVESTSKDYAVRTKQNVRDSDGTLILYRDRLQGGTLLTHRVAVQLSKPVLRVRIDRSVCYELIVRWLIQHNVRVLNVAGPRGSSHPTLQQRAYHVMLKLFDQPTLPLDQEPDR
ncbi:MAG: putative molybdenum carrier protein [Planctomycetales bacterium]|nr:putative molybdenum carrier protein [Planctomycetales bacterium]